MAARANLVLNDGATTPVSHTFKPAQSVNGVLIWRDSNTTIFAGQAVVSCVQRLADKKSKTTKVSWKLETPVLEVTSPSTSTGIQPAPTVAYRPLATAELVIPDRMSLQERKDLLAMFTNLLTRPTTTSQIQDLDLIY